MVFGDGNHRYEVAEGWGKLPAGYEWNQVAGVAVDSQDRVYAFNRSAHPLMIFDRDGNFIRSWGEGMFKNPHAIYVAPDKSMFLIDRDRHIVLKVTEQGEQVFTMGMPDQPQETTPFKLPAGVWQTEAGDIFVADGYGNSRTHRFSAGGTLKLSWGSPGDASGQFNLPHDVSVDKQGRVWVCDRQNNRLQIFTQEGQFLFMKGDLLHPAGIFIDGDGVVYVAELDGRVSILDPNGDLLARWGERGTEPGTQFIGPHSVWVDSRGDIYIGEVLQGQRLQKFVKI